jgi:hypothetical protein
MLLGAIYIILASSWNLAQAQVASCFNSGAAIPNNFSTWNWEEEPYVDPNNPSAGYRQAFCDAWRANITTTQVVPAYPMESPWFKPGSVGLRDISIVKDYRKADGWELVRMDFGASGSVPVPYFILYNKGTGVLRVFAFVLTPNPYTGIIFTMLHGGNNNYSNSTAGTRGLARQRIKAPDKYLTQPSSSNGDEEQTSYVAFFSGSGHWAMGQFTMLLDPNITNSAFNLNSYQIVISGLIESKVLIDGLFQYKTGLYADSDFSFSGSKSGPQTAPIAPGQNDPSIKQITIDAEKFLGGIANTATTLENIRTKAQSLSYKTASAADGPAADVKAKSDAVSKAAAGSVFKDLATVGSAFSSIFGIAGTIIGLLTDDASTAKQAFVPTYAKGTISMKGTITTKSNLHAFFLYTPGTSHSPVGSTPSTGPNAPFPSGTNTQLPYYSCPLGIFNISNTPVLRKIDYNRIVTENIEFDGVPGTGSEFTRSPYPKPFSSYALSYGDIKPIVNAESGLEIKTVKIAIAQKVPLNDVKEPYVNDYVINYGTSYIRTYNFLYSQITSGELEVYPYEPGTASDGSDAQVIVQTPFVEAGCLKNGASMLPFNVPNPPNSDRPVYLRLIAELHKIGTPANSAPVYFAQDYAVDIQDITSNYSLPPQHINTRPPFTAYYSGSYNPTGSLYYYDETKTGNLTYNANFPSQLAMRTLLFDQNSNVSVNGNVTSSGKPIAFRASQSVGVVGTLSVPFNSELAITTDFQSVAPDNYYSCNTTGITYDVTNLICYTDPRAGRLAGSTLATTSTVGLDSPALNLSPNPSSSSTLLQLKVGDAECISQADLLDVQGRVVWKRTFNCSHKLATDVSLNGLSAGIYTMRVTTSVRTYTCKLAVE